MIHRGGGVTANGYGVNYNGSIPESMEGRENMSINNIVHSYFNNITMVK